MLSGTVRAAVRQEAQVVYFAVVLCLLIATVSVVVRPTTYSAEASVLISPAAFLDPQSTDSLPELADTIVAVATSDAVLRRTARAYTQLATEAETAAARRRQATLPWLRRHIDVSTVGTSSVLEVSARAPQPLAARDLASAQVLSLQQFVRSGTGEPAGIRVVGVSGGRSRGLVSPRPIRDTVIALVAGLLLGCALAVLVSRQRGRVSPARVAADLGLPWLGTAAPEEAAQLLRGFLERVAISQRSRGQLALITGCVPADAIDQVTREAVRGLNERVTRGLLVDGELGVRAIRRRLPKPPRRPADGTPEGTPQDWAALPSGPPPPALLARAEADPPLASAPGGVHTASAQLWPEYEFVVLSGPALSRVDELVALVGSLHCVVVLIGPVLRASELDAIRALAREAEAAAAVVGVIGVMEHDAQLRSSA